MKHNLLLATFFGIFLMPCFAIAEEWYALTDTSCTPAHIFFNVEADGFSPEILTSGNERIVKNEGKATVPKVGEIELYSVSDEANNTFTRLMKGKMACVLFAKYFFGITVTVEDSAFGDSDIAIAFNTGCIALYPQHRLGKAKYFSKDLSYSLEISGSQDAEVTYLSPDGKIEVFVDSKASPSFCKMLVAEGGYDDINAIASALEADLSTKSGVSNAQESGNFHWNWRDSSVGLNHSVDLLKTADGLLITHEVWFKAD